MNYSTIKVRFQEAICFLQLDRVEANNTINDRLLTEIGDVLSVCEESTKVLVLSGSPEIFCLGADFQALVASDNAIDRRTDRPEMLYDLWLRLTTAPFVTIAHVTGKANAGGTGFVAASDIVLASDTAQFSLSELLFGLYPACVLPFLIRRVGFQRANYLSLITHPISAKQACEWGLVDAFEKDSDILLKRHLLRLRGISKTAIRRYKAYMVELSRSLVDCKSVAVKANREIFADPANLEAITRYVERGIFPWEKL